MTDGGAFETWYRDEHRRLVTALAMVAGDRQEAEEAAAEAFAATARLRADPARVLMKLPVRPAPSMLWARACRNPPREGEPLDLSTPRAVISAWKLCCSEESGLDASASLYAPLAVPLLEVTTPFSRCRRRGCT